MSTFLKRTSTLAAVALLTLAVCFGLTGAQQAYAAEGSDDLTVAGLQVQDDLEQGYYAAVAESSSSMIPLVGESQVIYVDAEGNASLLVKIQNNQGKYDYVWKGTQEEGKAKVGEDGKVAVTDDMYRGIPIPAEPGCTTVWLDDKGHYGVEGATYKALLFIIPLSADELAAGKFNFLIRRSPWTPLGKDDPEGATVSSNAEKWMGSKDNEMTFTIGAKIETKAANPELPAASSIEAVTTKVGAVPEDATIDDAPVYTQAEYEYSYFVGQYGIIAGQENFFNKSFMDAVIPEAAQLLAAAESSIPNVVPADGTYTFLANMAGTTTGKEGVAEDLGSSRLPSATLVVADGKMTLTFEAASSSYPFGYMGTPADAAALESAAIAAGGTYEDVSEYFAFDGKFATIEIKSLEKPVIMCWRSKSSSKWFTRAVVFHQSNMGTEPVIGLANDVNKLLNDPFGKAEGDVQDPAYRIDPWIVTADSSEAISAANEKYEALSADDKALFDELAVWGKYADELPYGRVLEEAVWALDSLAAVDDATTLAAGDYTGQPVVAINSGKDAASAAAWSLAALNVKDGKTIATIEDASGLYSKVKIGGQEYDKTAAGFEIPVDLNTQLVFLGLYETKDSKDVSYETAKAFQLKIDLDEATVKPNVSIEVPKATADLKYTGQELTGVAAGEGYEVAGGTGAEVGTYKATVTLKPGFVWTDGTYDAQEIEWGIAKGASTISLAAPAAVTFDGKAVAYKGKVTKVGSTGQVTYGYFSDAACAKAVSAAQVKNAGTYYVKATLAGDANYDEAVSEAVKLVINPAKQTIKATKATYKIKAKKVKKKAKKIAVKFSASGGGKVTYAAAKSGKVSIAKNGKITVKKGAKKGTYTLKVKATAAANGNYAATAATVKVKVKVA